MKRFIKLNPDLQCKIDFDEAVLFHKSFFHEHTLTNSFLQGATNQQNWAASTRDLLRSIWIKNVVSFFLFIANVQN